MNTPSLGIDMAKQSFLAALRFDSNRVLKMAFENHVRGFRKLRIWLKQHGVGHLRVAIESTNVYAEALAQWLYDQGHQVFLLNPERVAHYARSVGQRNKTDPADAVTIAAFIALHDATPWLPLSAEQKILRSLTRTRQQLVATSNEVSNQLRTADSVAQPHLQAVLQSIRKQLTAIERAIAAHLRAFPVLGEQVRRLMTTKGVGLVTAAVVIAELPPITPQSDPRAICSWAGLTPRRYQSGNKEFRSRISRKGNAYLRQALYMPALVARRYNPVLKTFAQRLANEGKSSGAILGAVSHKMLRILVGLLRTNTDFDPNWSLQKA